MRRSGKNPELEAAEAAVADAARLLVRAAGVEAFDDTSLTRAGREDIIRECRRWIRSGLTATSDSDTEEACARKILQMLGEPE